MNSIPTDLATLLHALHEGRLDDCGVADLERRVLSDPAAMRAYLDLTAVHGNLVHDAGSPGPRTRPTPAAPPRENSRWHVPLALAASLLLLTGAAILLRPVAPAPAPGIVETVPAPPPAEPDPAPVAPSARTPEPELLAATPRPALTAPKPTPRPAAVAAAPRAEVVDRIDAALAAGWEAAEVAPSPEADPGEWLRRAWLDLAGHAPPADEVARFLADDRPDRRRRELDRLLNGSAFPQHLAERWTTELIGRAPRDGVDRAGLRSHLAAQFDRNAGWDLIAADLVAATGSVEEAPAANFLVAHVNNAAVPATAVTARVLLGTRIQCMQCHDHPRNGGGDWSQDRFWELNAFFKGTDVVDRPGPDGARVAALEAKADGGPTFYEDRRGVMKATFPRYADETVEAAEGRRQRLAELLLSDDSRLPARSFVNRAWAHLFGAGLVNPVDDLGPHNPPSHPAVLEALTERFVATGYDVRDLYATLTGTRLYGLTGAAVPANAADDPGAGEVPLFTRCYPKPLTVEQTFDSLAALSGRPIDPAARDAWVARFVRRQGNDENAEDLAAATDIPRALALMNGDLTDAAVTAGGPDDLDGVFLAALSRRPTPAERRRLTPLARVPGGLEDLRWALLNSGEFATVP